MADRGYSFSRFKTFQTCAKKHHYAYVEDLQVEDSEFLKLGSLFHSMIEHHFSGQLLDEIIKEYKREIKGGFINRESDLLEYVFDLYVNHYKDEHAMEKVLLLEKTIEEDLEGTDKLKMVLDKVVEVNGLNILRDTKTTSSKLKYTLEDVKINQQLLFYLPYAERELGISIDAIEIDEVRLAKLEKVPMTSKDRPSANKKLLELVLYEDYLQALEEQDLDKEPEYKHVLEFLEKRGHPLFQRVRYQVLDKSIVDANLSDIRELYKATKQDINYRNPGWQCQYCPFKQLCDLDKFNPDEQDREIIIRSIKPSEE